MQDHGCDKESSENLLQGQLTSAVCIIWAHLLIELSVIFGTDQNTLKKSMASSTTPTNRLASDDINCGVLKTNNRKTRSITDQHNETCDVCGIGGNLLCCDTCTLVFHVSCVRPKLSAVPNGSWSCPHCVVEVRCLSFRIVLDVCS